MGDPREHIHNRRAFTLAELLVSTVVLVILLGIVFTVTSSTGAAVSRASARIDAFAASRAAFDLISQRLSQATLNPYYDYFDAQGRAPNDPYYTGSSTPPTFVPARYGRQSDLQFLVRQNTQNAGYGQEIYFVSPHAYSNQSSLRTVPGLLNACSYFVQYSSDAGTRPALGSLPVRWRYRLMQGMQPTEGLQIFQSVVAPLAANRLRWLDDIKNAGPSAVSPCVAPLADNVLALVVWPRLSGAEDPAGTGLSAIGGPPYPFTYDSRGSVAAGANPGTINQLPPGVQLTMLVLGEVAAVRPGNAATPPAAIESALSGKFADIASYQSDLRDVSAALTATGVPFQVFSTTVPLRESRWTGVNP